MDNGKNLTVTEVQDVNEKNDLVAEDDYDVTGRMNTHDKNTKTQKIGWLAIRHTCLRVHVDAKTSRPGTS